VRFSPLESTGLSVSRLAFAATSFAADDWDLASLHKVDAALADSLLGRALDVGINFSDTAGFYAGGVSERVRAGRA
jgi:aryl-alcohol dehydrogenase-like predicted oxidoreductase